MNLEDEQSASSFKGKESFYDFFRDEGGALSRNGRSRPNIFRPQTQNQIYRSEAGDLVAKVPSVHMPQSEKEVRDLMSANLTFKNFDVQHLDHFLRTSEWARTPSNNQLTSPALFTSKSLTANQSSKKNVQKPHGTTLFSDLPRVDYKSNYTNENPLVRLSNQTQSLNAEKFFRSQLQLESPIADLKEKIRLEASADAETNRQLRSSASRRKEMAALKQEREDFSKWKSEHLLRKKRFRIIKGQFKSGILQTDDPYYDQTKLYEEERRLLLNKKGNTPHGHQKSDSNKYKEKHHVANPVIEADNVLFRLSARESEKPSTSTIDFRSSIPKWSSKARVPEGLHNCNSAQRIFSPLESGTTQSEIRKQFIRRNQTRGRDYDIITKEYLKE